MAHPPGHFYSSIVDTELIKAKKDKIWGHKNKILGIDFNDKFHKEVLGEYFPEYIGLFDYPEKLKEHGSLTDFYVQNSQFSWLDCRTLFVLLNVWKPARMIEVGSGFSSLLTADVNRRFLDNKLNFSCVEPFPREFLKKEISGLNSLIVEKVEDVPLSVFAELKKNDILFIDSSHVSKTDSDVNYLVFEVLPRLKKGVKIHIHDIFLPNEYPMDWVINENRSWNEQYLIRALLMYSTAFKVLFSCSYAISSFPELVGEALSLPDKRAYGGGSLWLERT